MSEAPQCLNCSRDLDIDAKYCPGCGQKVRPVKTPLWDLLGDAWSATIAVDGRFVSSFRYLLSRPGFLSSEYMAGRRVAYLRPVTIFLLAAGAFFLTVEWLQSIRSQEVVIAEGDNIQRIEFIPGFNVTLTGNELRQVFKASDEQISELVENKGFGNVSDFQEFVATKSIRLVRDGGVLALRHRVADVSSRTVALLIPIMAVLVKLLHLRRKVYFVDATIYCMHLHAFLFLIMLFLSLLPNATWRDMSLLLLMPLTWLYTAVSLRRAFGNGLIMAWVKAFVLLLVHSVFVGILTTILVLVLLLFS